MIKWLLVIALAIGFLAGYVASTIGSDPNSFEMQLKKSEWTSKQINRSIAGLPQEPEPSWDTRPWASKNPVAFGGVVSAVTFVIGLLVVIASNSQTQRVPSENAGLYTPDADLFENFDDPYDEEEAPPASSPEAPSAPAKTVRANPRRKKARA